MAFTEENKPSVANRGFAKYGSAAVLEPEDAKLENSNCEVLP